MKLKKMLLLALSIFSASVFSQSEISFTLDIEIPKIHVSEYHAPYVATWIENEKRKAVVSTSLWYDDQEKWLKDIRQWWRKTGRSQSKPYDGVTGASRRPGMHKLSLNSTDIGASLSDGNYTLFIEAAREVGGREVLKLPFSWPIKDRYETSAQGQKELGNVTLKITPNKNPKGK